MSSVKKACIASICTALCYVLPLAFHALGVGSAFSPMHIPVLLCGLICGWSYGAFCGIAGPVISSLLSGMPSTIQLIYMVPELLTYGLVSGLLMKVIRTRHTYADMYLSLIPAMILGRIVGGIAQAVFYISTAREYSVAIWASAYFIGSIPAIILHLVILPSMVMLLMKAHLIPARYGKGSAKEHSNDIF
jgi:hypothetical protein